MLFQGQVTFFKWDGVFSSTEMGRAFNFEKKVQYIYPLGVIGDVILDK